MYAVSSAVGAGGGGGCGCGCGCRCRCRRGRRCRCGYLQAHNGILPTSCDMRFLNVFISSNTPPNTLAIAYTLPNLNTWGPLAKHHYCWGNLKIYAVPQGLSMGNTVSFLSEKNGISIDNSEIKRTRGPLTNWCSACKLNYLISGTGRFHD